MVIYLGGTLFDCIVRIINKYKKHTLCEVEGTLGRVTGLLKLLGSK